MSIQVGGWPYFIFTLKKKKKKKKDTVYYHYLNSPSPRAIFNKLFVFGFSPEGINHITLDFKSSPRLQWSPTEHKLSCKVLGALF